MKCRPPKRRILANARHSVTRVPFCNPNVIEAQHSVRAGWVASQRYVFMRRNKGVATVRFSSRNWIVGMAAAVAIVISAGVAWGCVALVAFRTNGSGTVQPGGTVEVFGGEFARGEPVHIRLDSPDGPILYTHENPLPSTMTSQFTVQVPIPANITPGPHVLVATQEHYDMNVGIPARAAIYVNTSPPAAPTPQDRAVALVESDGPGVARYVLVGLGVAAAGLLLAAVASTFAARRPATGEPERVKG